MELEHAYQQSEFIAALQLLAAGSLLVPGALGRSDMFRAFVGSVTSYVVSFGPLAVLIYVLYRVSQLS